jgi:tRNA1(Val) A37 N6-methylase TrmN6
MGILHKLTFILGKLDPDNTQWRNIQHKNALEQMDKALNIVDKSERQQRLKEIDDIFESESNLDDYGRKLYIIENCLFGIDIQPIAIQITKLRFFISLIVDQKPKGDINNNYGIIPLPNLETKFIAANTLIGVTKKDDAMALFEDTAIEKLQAELLEIRHKHFSAKTARQKTALREKDKVICAKLARLLEEHHYYTNKDAIQMADWDPYNQNKHAEFFDTYWMFGIKDGFDVVIGNPPYLKEGKVLKNLFDCIRGTEYYQGKMDLWYAFACYGIDFLKDSGHLCFIATNNWTTNSGSSKLRNKIINDTKIIQMVDFSNFMIFESANIQTMVMQFQKNKNENDYSFDYRKLYSEAKFSDVMELLHKKQNKNAEYLTPTVVRNNLKDAFLVFSADENIFSKIRHGKVFLTKKEIAQGVVFPQDFLNKKNKNILGNNFSVGEGIFGLSNQEKQDLQLSEKELKLIKPYYTTKQIHRYYSNSINSLWLIYTDSSFKNVHSMDKYPKLKRHLDKYKKIITSDNKPYGLHRAREERFFKSEKVIALRKCVDRPLFSYSTFDCYISQAFYIIKTERFNMKYLLGLFNSKLMMFWLKNKGKMQGDNFQLDKEPLLAMPIQPITKEREKSFTALVDQIIDAKAADLQADTSVLEARIDKMVYELYGLSEAEIKIVEGTK